MLLCLADVSESASRCSISSYNCTAEHTWPRHKLRDLSSAAVECDKRQYTMHTLANNCPRTLGHCR